MFPGPGGMGPVPGGPGSGGGGGSGRSGAKSSSSNKEANLMPVPSPQQIQFINPMEAQELTIHRQPNTCMGRGPAGPGGDAREQDLMSPK